MSKTRKDFETDEEYRDYRNKRNVKEKARRDKIRPEINAREKARTDKIRPEINARNKVRRDKIRPEINFAETQRRRKDRLDALNAYSEGVAHCLHCGETQIEFLTLDHISGRKSMGHAKHIKGKALYSRLRRDGYPPGMQILCWNWNEIKGKADQWQKAPKTKRGIRDKKNVYRSKIEVLTHYCSGKKPYCVCCEYNELAGLTIDHIHGRKKIPEDEAKATGHALRLLLKKKNYPPNYQVLCFNCNSAKSNKDTCPGLLPKHKLKLKLKI